MPRPAAIAAAPTPEKLDNLLDQVEHAINALNEVWQRDQAVTEDYRTGEEALLKELASLRDLIKAFVKEVEAGRPGITNVFGEDTGRVVRMQVVFQSCNELFSDEAHEDKRWEESVEIYQTLEKHVAPQEPEEQQGAPTQGEVAEGEAEAAATTSAAEQSAEQVGAEAGAEVAATSEEAPVDQQQAPGAGAQEGRRSLTSTGLPAEAPKPGAPHGDVNSAVAPSNPQREMRGELTLENGVKYTGEWCGNVRDGEGVELRPDGSSYMGQFVMGQAHGKGIYTQPDGLTIAGHWIGGKLNGSGLESHPDGTTYEGQYKEGVKSGFGTYTYEEGSVYEGQFCNDGMHGNGIYISANGDHGGRYQGEWNENRMHGTGLFKVPDGRMYDGEYAYDRRNGTGTFTWPDGRVHEGQWRAGKMHGVGKAVFPDGNEKLGEWQDGKLLRWEESATAGLHNAANSNQARGPPAVVARHEEERKRKLAEEAAQKHAETQEADENERKHREMMEYGEQQATRLSKGDKPDAVDQASGGATGQADDDDDGAANSGEAANPRGAEEGQEKQWRPPGDEATDEKPVVRSS